MKKNYIILLLFSLFFINILNVRAGVCDDVKGHRYCSVDKTLKNSISFKAKEKLEKYFIRAGFEAKIDGQSYASVCIDPALSAPKEAFRNVREIDLSTNYDKGIYKIYQKFINEINYVDYSHNIAYFQYASRIWTIKNGYAYVSEGVNYKNDAANFVRCSKFIDSSITTTTSLSSSYSKTDCFGTHQSIINDYYNRVNENYWWTDPFENNSNISTTTQTNPDGSYTFNFTVDFKNFFTSYSNAVKKGNVNLNPAQFKACVSINDEDCFQDETKVRWISNELGNTDNNIFTLTLTPEEYNSYFPSGQASVTLQYTYHHPMNPDNLFISRYNADEMGYQRMIIVKEHESKGRKTIGVSHFVEKNICSHTTSGFTDSAGESVSTIADYYASCGCTANESLLSGGDLDFYKNNCDSTITNELYSGEISSCNDSQVYEVANSNTNFENYNLGYKKTTTINSYCYETCNETIAINDLKGRYTTLAGRYFYFNKYPELIANKNCTMTVKYNDWFNDYFNTNTSDLGLLNKEINNYNDKVFDDAVNSATVVGSGTCSSGTPPSTCGSYTNYKYYYNVYYYDATSNNINSITNSGSYTIASDCCGSSNKPAARYTSGSIDIILASLNTHFNDLKTCYTYLRNNYGEDANNFYPFEVDLNYYYEQEFSNDDYKWELNNERPNNINDSDFKPNDYEENPSQTGNYNDFYNENTYMYPYISGTSSFYNPNAVIGIGTQKFYSNDVQINRNVEYNVEYERPLKPKYVDSYTSSITESSTGDNSIYLGYVYDIDISAKTGSKATGHTNENYYEFTKLGDTSNNRLFNHFKTGSSIRRYCDYEITSDLTGCKDGNCKLNIVYRSVDPSNIDPNGRLLEDNKGFNNWKTTNAQVVKKKIEDDAKTKDTYSPENLEYSFTLDSATIAAIKKSNKEDKITNQSIYDRWDKSSYSCTEGNKCESTFISNANGVDGNTGSIGIKFGTNFNGREKWKQITSIGGNKYTIDGKEVILNS